MKGRKQRKKKSAGYKECGIGLEKNQKKEVWYEVERWKKDLKIGERRIEEHRDPNREVALEKECC